MDTHTKKSNSEKPTNIEQQFQIETGENFSEIENLKVSEAVGETVGENFSDGTKSTQTVQKQEEKKEEGLMSSSRAQKIILPTIEKQRMKVKRALEKEQKQLIQKAKKLSPRSFRSTIKILKALKSF